MSKINEITKEERLAQINKKVSEVLGRQKDKVVVIKSQSELRDYITCAVSAGVIAIDTETNNSTDPITCKIMGLCLYVPNLKQAYVPVNHRDWRTQERLSWQVSEEDIKVELQRVIDSNTMIIMHNGKFDYQVLKCTCGIEVRPNWDTMIAAQLLNENELAGLKSQYRLHIDPAQEKYDIEKLFSGVSYADVDTDIFALYAATDSMMTYRLYEYQKELFLGEEKGLYKLFRQIEVPVSIIAADMELYGAYVDLKYQAKLLEKYSAIKEQVAKAIYRDIDSLSDIVLAWRQSEEAERHETIFPKIKDIQKLTSEQYEEKYPLIDSRTGMRYRYGTVSKGKKLKDPIGLGSSDQLAVLFYDVFGVRKTRMNSWGKTGSDDLKAVMAITEYERGIIKEYLDNPDDVERKNEAKRVIKHWPKLFAKEEDIEIGYNRLAVIIGICEKLIEARKVDKVISTYLKPIPLLASHWPDGKVRFHLKTLGARTGRFSSGGDWHFMEGDEKRVIKGMNQQGLPSENHEIRLLFKAPEGRVFVGGDFSQQEPSVAAFISQDEKMLQTFREGKDIYATIAQAIFNNNYEDNLEFADEEKTIYVDGGEGKKRRKVGKIIILASMYGMSEGTVAKNLGKTKEEAHKILEDFFSAFSGLKRAQDNTIKHCKKYGYVVGIWGRKRRLPDMQLPNYGLQFLNATAYGTDTEKAILNSYALKVDKLNKQDEFLSGSEFEKLLSEARKHNVIIVSNEDRIRKASCQAFNARIQGSSSTMTKQAMILIDKDPIMRECGARLVFQIHDELIVDCSEDKAEIVRDRLTYIMTHAVDVLGMDLPMRCDPVIEKRWGENSIPDELREEYDELEKGGEKAPFEELCRRYLNFPPDSIKKALNKQAKKIEFEW